MKTHAVDLKRHTVQTGYEASSIKSQDANLCPVHWWEVEKPVLPAFWFCHCRPNLLHPLALLYFPLPAKENSIISWLCKKNTFQQAMFRPVHATICKHTKGFFKFYSKL